MIVSNSEGRHRSEQTIQERRDAMKAKWDGMSEKEKATVLSMIDELDYVSVQGESMGFDGLAEIMNSSPIYHQVSSDHYDGPLVPVEDFYFDEHYMGRSGEFLYPTWREDLVALDAAHYNEVIITGSIGGGKCLDGDTEFVDPVSGKRERLSDVCGPGKPGFRYVHSFDQNRGEVRSARAEFKLSGQKVLGDLVLGSGKEIRMSPDHPVMTLGGWRSVGDLQRGDLIATARVMPVDGRVDISDDEVEFVAFMLTEGSCSSGNWAFTNANEKVIRRYIDVARALWRAGERVSKVKKNVSVIEQKGDMVTLSPRGTRWVQHKYGLYETSHSKRFPAFFVGLNDRQAALFLNRVWACDGSIVSKSSLVFEITLASKHFISDLQQMLLRFGIHSRFGRVRKSYRHKGEKRYSWAWTLRVKGGDSVLAMCDLLGPVLGKEGKWNAARELAADIVLRGRGNTNVDVTPVSKDVSVRIRKELGVSAKEWIPYRVPGKQRLSRAKLLEIRGGYGLPEWCSWWPDVFWDTVDYYREDGHESPIYDVEVPGLKNFTPGGVIVHNTTFCNMGLIREFYCLCMLRDPQATFGLMPGTDIVLVCFNRDKKLARDVTFGGVKNLIEGSPFFQKLGLKIGTSELVYPKKNIRIIAASVRSSDALGKNVYGGLIDETDFLQGSSLIGDGLSAPGVKSFAERLHSSVIGRMKSRYVRAGALPGKLFMSSSARHKSSFTNKRIGECRKMANVFVRDYALYEAQPAERFKKERFWVLVGNERIKHRLLSDEEYASFDDEDIAEIKEKGCRFLHVPVDFRSDFETNIEKAVQDIGGVVTPSMSRYIQLSERIHYAIDPTLFHPMETATWATNERPRILWDKIVRRTRKKLGPGRYEDVIEPIRNPNSPRHVHIDLSKGATDPAGLCIAHTVDMIEVDRREENGGKTFREEVPLMEVDLLLQILPPRDGEIDFGAIRGLVYDFMDHGYSIQFASLDSWQSADTIQKFRQQGIKSTVVSTWKTTDPYDALKTAIYEGRMSYYDYPVVIEELEQLEKNEAKQKIDHPTSGSKDVADALAGVAFTLSTHASGRVSLSLGISEYERDDQDTEWIRKTMVHGGDKAPIKVGDTPPEGAPLIVTG